MALTSMKMTAQESRMLLAGPADRPPEYPYGLRIRLEREQLEKLGLTALPAIGETFTVSAHDSAEGGESRSLELQITDLALGRDGAISADDFYGRG